MVRVILVLLIAFISEARRPVAQQGRKGELQPGETDDAGLDAELVSLAEPPSLIQLQALAGQPLGSPASVEARMRRTSREKALRAVGGRKDLPHKVKATLLQAFGGGHKGHRLRHNRTRKEDLDASQEMLSKLTEETARKLDLERVRCDEYEDRQRRLIEEASQDLSMFQSSAADARGKILRAQYTLHNAQRELPKLQDSLKAHEEKCEFDHDSLTGQINMMQDDIATLGDLGACEEGSSQLLQCRAHEQGKVLVSLGGKNVSRMHSHFARTAVQKALQRVYAAAAAAAAETLASAEPDVETVLLETKRRGHRVVRTAAAGSGLRHGSVSCVGARSSDCSAVNAEFLKVQAGLMDKWEDLKEQLGSAQASCQSVARSFKSQITAMQEQQRDGDAALAEGTKNLNMNEEQYRLKNLQSTDLQGDMKKSHEDCQASLESFESELCSLKTVRVQVEKMAGNDGAVQDCSVSDWVPEACSATCGGGAQVLHRSVVASPVAGGATCPPLEMTRSCNQQSCPVDCQVGDWGEWSSCSARCSGGVRQRIRPVSVEPLRGGQSCEQTSETEGCNLQSCDADCELSDWSEWSACSKACDAGSITRTKEVLEDAVGRGTCPEPDSDTRMESLPCHRQSCANSSRPDENITCDAKLDVVLMIDGGGFGEDGVWDAVLSAGSKLLNRLAEGDMRTGALLFSGPTQLDAYKRCTLSTEPAKQAGSSLLQLSGRRMRDNHLEGPDLEADCKLQWASRLDSDTSSVVSAVEGLSRSTGTALTARAVMSAQEELRRGRSDAQSAIVVVSDRAPISGRAMAKVAEKVRATTRLMWVAVAPSSPMDEIRTWVSRPDSENVVTIANASNLDDDASVTQILANLCGTKLKNYAEPMPSCSVLDGSGKSAAYPCSCGFTECEDGYICSAADNKCLLDVCTVHDGSDISEIYPCQCGAAVCSGNGTEKCDAHVSKCYETECWEDDTSYAPDMEGGDRTIEDNILACQKRCASVHGCAHFSFWKKDGHCHLADKEADHVNDIFGGVAGPPYCSEENTPAPPCSPTPANCESSEQATTVITTTTKVELDYEVVANPGKCQGEPVESTTLETNSVEDCGQLTISHGHNYFSYNSDEHSCRVFDVCDTTDDDGSISVTYHVVKNVIYPECWSSDFKYSPNLDGHEKTNESSIIDCQKRCENADGCRWFTHCEESGDCTLHGPSATKTASEGCKTGPSICGMTDEAFEESQATPAPPPPPAETPAPEVLTECWENDTKYTPINMDGQEKTTVDSIEKCQERCASVDGCAHFSYYPDGGCHVQDSYAEKADDEYDGKAGPPSCDPDQTTTAAVLAECWEADTAYDPINMDGQEKTVEGSIFKCQERCAGVDGCAHFAFYSNNGGCHLQDADATSQADEWGGQSGPPSCDSNDSGSDDSTTAAAEVLTECWEEDKSYTPINMDGQAKTTEDSIEKCQERCANVDGCAHFASYPDGGCHVQDGYATVQDDEWGAKSGPPSCNAADTTTAPVLAECWEDDKAYSPIDMDGQAKTVEGSIFKCQERCASVDGCAHFSSYPDGGCHLQDADATLQDDSWGGQAGPPECPS